MEDNEEEEDDENYHGFSGYGDVGGILSGLTRGPVRLTLLARTKAHMGVSPNIETAIR